MALLLLPFFWLGEDASLGGDDTRLYFVYPWRWLQEFALPAFGNLSGFGNLSAQQHFLPFTTLFAAIGFALPFLNLEALAFGIALASGFAGVYATALLVMPRQASQYRPAVATIAGLMYVSAPLVATMVWSSPLAWVLGIDGAPVLVALAVAYLRDGRLRWLPALVALDALYAPGLATLPISLPFAFGGAIVAVAVLLMARRPRRLLRRLVTLSLVLLGANIFWLLPLLASIGTPGTFGDSALQQGGTTGNIVRTVAQGQSILDTLLVLPSGQFEKNWGWQTYRFWPWENALMVPTLALPTVLGVALLRGCYLPRRQQGLLVALTAATLFLAFCQTVNLTPVGVDVFAALTSRVPGFAMFRNFYSKFAGAYVFFYALAFAGAAASLLPRLGSRRSWALTGILSAVILLQGGPLLLGMPLFLPMQAGQGAVSHYTSVGRFPPSYLRAMAALSARQGTGRVLELPLSTNYWSEVPLAGSHGVYVGSSPVRILSGVQSFNSLESFTAPGVPDLQDRLERAINAQDYVTLAGVLRLTGIRYLLYTDGIPAAVRDRWMRQPAFPASVSNMDALARSLRANKIATYSDGSSVTEVLYALPEARTLPSLFVTSRTSLLPTEGDLIDAAAKGATGAPRGADAAIPVASLVAGQASDQVVLADQPDTAVITALRHPTAWRYELNITAAAPSLLVLLNPYGADWRAHVQSAPTPTASRDPGKVRVDGYATGWMLASPGQYTITLSYAPQRLTWIALAISLLTLVALVASAAVEELVYPKCFHSATSPLPWSASAGANRTKPEK